MAYVDAKAMPLKEREAMRGSPSLEGWKVLASIPMHARKRETRERVSVEERAAETLFVEGEGDRRTIVALVNWVGKIVLRVPLWFATII